MVINFFPNAGRFGIFASPSGTYPFFKPADLNYLPHNDAQHQQE
jgi:hypothetical protein